MVLIADQRQDLVTHLSVNIINRSSSPSDSVPPTETDRKNDVTAPSIVCTHPTLESLQCGLLVAASQQAKHIGSRSQGISVNREKYNRTFQQ